MLKNNANIVKIIRALRVIIFPKTFAHLLNRIVKITRYLEMILRPINNFAKIYLQIQVHQFNVIMELRDNFAKILIIRIILELKISAGHPLVKKI